jgi:hypothetical protein
MKNNTADEPALRTMNKSQQETNRNRSAKSPS